MWNAISLVQDLNSCPRIHLPTTITITPRAPSISKYCYFFVAHKWIHHHLHHAVPLSRVKWSNPGKGVAPSPTPRCSRYWKGRLQVTLDYSRQLYLLYIVIIIIMSCRRHRYPWPSLATSPYHSSLLAGLQSYIPYPHIAAVCIFDLVVLLLHGHIRGSIGVHHLWARPCFSSSVLHVWFV